MIASSAFVLTALTMTGIYMQSKDPELENDGYTIDFTALENNVNDMYQEIARSEGLEENLIEELEDDLDYMPLEVGSGQIEIPGLTDKKTLNEVDVPDADVAQALSVNEAETAVDPEDMDPVENPEEPSQEGQENEAQETSEAAMASQELHFSEREGLVRPLNGETVIPFSTESSVYFSTLDQYKRNPAMMITAAEGTAVAACAEGKVVNIFENEEIGHAITMELGDGYRITYGQLRDIQVSLGSYVNVGDTIGTVATPTKYYVREGSNLYLKLTANETPVDPEPLFR